MNQNRLWWIFVTLFLGFMLFLNLKGIGIDFGFPIAERGIKGLIILFSIIPYGLASGEARKIEIMKLNTQISDPICIWLAVVNCFLTIFGLCIAWVFISHMFFLLVTVLYWAWYTLDVLTHSCETRCHTTT